MRKGLALFFAFLISLTAAMPAYAATPFATVDGNSITFRDDGTGEPIEDQYSKKVILATTRNIGLRTELDDCAVTINSLQVAKFTFYNQEMADYAGVDKDAPFTLIGIDLTVENTGASDLYLKAADSFVITNEKEQVACFYLLSAEYDGLLLSGAARQDQLYFFCKKTSILDFKSFRFLLGLPTRADGTPTGDRLIFEFFYELDALNGETKEAALEAWDLLDSAPQSQSDLRDTLSFLGYSEEAIDGALDWLRIDWVEQAARAVRDWIDTISAYDEPEETRAQYLSYEFLYNMLTDTLSYTQEEAVAALSLCDISCPN